MRINDLTIPRKPIAHDSDFTEYWHNHAPTAHDLAELFGISIRRVRELWQEGWITKGAPLNRAVGEWATYQAEVLGKPGHIGGRKPGHG